MVRTSEEGTNVKIHSTKKKTRSGTLEAAEGQDGATLYRGRLRLADGTKSGRFELPEGLDESAARAYLASLQQAEDATGQLLAAKLDRAREDAARTRTPHALETADAWFARYLPAKECGNGHRRTTRQWWAMWISPVLGAKPVASLTRDDLEDVRDELDRAIDAGRIRTTTARNVWSIVTSAMKAASAAKDRSLRVHAAPLHFGILPPKRGASRQRPWLFPREWLKLATCEEVPVVERSSSPSLSTPGSGPGSSGRSRGRTSTPTRARSPSRRPWTTKPRATPRRPRRRPRASASFPSTRTCCRS